MFEEVDSLGVSQGQGRGFAQVFDSTYNPVFKEEGNRLLAEQKAGKKEIDKQLESIDGSVWFRDADLVKTELGNLYQYVQDNNRNILKGNTTEAIEYKKKINDIKTIVANAKLAEQETTKLLFELNKNENKYDRKKSTESLQAFLDKPGDFDVSQLQLHANFDAMKHQKDLAGLVGKITQQTQLLPGFEDLNDNTIYKKYVSTIDSEIEKNARSLWLDLPESGREHYGNFDKYLDVAKTYAKDSASQIVKGKTPDSSLSKQAEQTPNEIKFNQKLNFSQKVGGTSGNFFGEEEVIGFTDDQTVSIAGTGFNVTDKANFTPNKFKEMKGVIFDLRGKYKAEKGKDGYTISDGKEIEDGQNIIDALIKDQGSADFIAESIQLIPVFKGKIFATNKKGKKINLSNTVVSEDMLRKGKIHNLSLSDANVEYVPYVLGTYKKSIDDDKQSNFGAGIPYDEYKQSMQNTNTTKKELLMFEEQEQVKNELLKTYSFTEGNKKAGIETQQPQQTKKANDSTQKVKPMTREQFDEFAKNKGKVATDADYKKYLNDLKQ